MLLILVPKETNRLRYTMQLMLTRLLGLEIQYTCDSLVFGQHKGPKFSYGVSVDEHSLFFAATALLFESKILAKDLKHFQFEGSPVFFPVPNKDSALPFDLFAAAFYLVSRYEEYLPHIRDSHNRFLASGSDAFQNGYLNKPLVNTWSIIIKSLLQKRFPYLKFSCPVYTFLPTIDVDAAYAYKNKGLTRAAGSILKTIQKRDYDGMRHRLRVFFRLERDPFDTFELQMKLQQKYGYRPIYFILLADYGTNDKNIPYNNRYFQSLIRYLADYAEIGIHPSYASSLQPSLMVMETARLSKILKLEVEYSRQHFLKLVLPETYRNLINNDISHDYSMGYAEVTGFRASICTPFPFYDLDQDLPTNLMIHPFAVMDGTLNDYLKLTPQQAIDRIKELITEVKKVGGTFIPLWHNSTLNNEGDWRGWLEVYTRMIEEASGNFDRE
ncbi:MAG: polysaccharide deacetylase family protein [Bacteroidota bacterium]